MDECAKIHVRHMIGGIPTPPLANEQFLESNFLNDLVHCLNF